MRYKIGLVALVIVLFFVAKGLLVTKNEVVLHNPISGKIQMWANPGAGGDADATFTNGTSCIRLDGPQRFKLDDGIYSDYYRLNCGGKSGFVNVNFVSR